MQSVFRNLFQQPTLLLDGRAFYPLGRSLTLAEPLVTPSLVAGPLLLVTRNPVLAYNLTLVILWAASGWAAYAVARWLTGSDAAALVALLVFTLAPARIDYAPEFQMEMTFGMPLAVYAWVRFLESHRPRHLAAFLLVFWLQAIAVWYFAVILGIGLAVLTVQVLALRWTRWRLSTLLSLGVGGVLLGAALSPVAVPYSVPRQELGLQRGLGAIDESRYADLVTYLQAQDSLVWRSFLFRSDAEVSLFVGALALGVALLAAAWVVGQEDRERGWAERAV